MDKILSNRLQIWGFEAGVCVFADASLGAVLKISPLDVSCQDDEAINSIKENLRTFLNGLPVNAKIQFFQEIVSGNGSIIQAHQETLKEKAHPITREITAERVESLKRQDENGEIPKTNLYLIVRLPFQKPLTVKRRLFSESKTEELSEDRLEIEIKTFKRKVREIQESLMSCGIEASTIPEIEIYRLMFNQWNPDHPVDARLSTASDIRDQVCLTDLMVGPDHFQLGKFYHKVISLKILPEQTFSSMAEYLRDLPFDSRLYLSIDVLDQAKEINSLQMQRRMTFAQVAGSRGVSDLDAQAKLKDIESLLEDMIQGNERVFRMSLNVLLRSVSEIELESQVAQTLQRLRELSGAEGLVETVASFDLFSEFSIPNAKSTERLIRVNTSVLSDFLPIYGAWAGHETPRVILKNRDSGLFSFDPFSRELTNANQIVSGGSGAGKSFATNILLSQMAKESPKVFIIDIGGSYQKITENLDGQYIELGIKSGLSINPFSSDGLEVENRNQKIKFLLGLVELMTKEEQVNSIGKLEKSEIEKIIREVLDVEKDPMLRHLQERLVQSEDKEINRIGRVLSLWCHDSPYGKFVDRPTNISLSKDIVCFDLKGLEQHSELQSICLFLITDLIWREVQRDRTKMKFTIFDECWKLLENDAGSTFIGEVFRTYRKYRASAIAISQTMDDFAKSKIGPAIMPNSSIKWILRQRGADQESLQSSLSLNEREMSLISSLRSEKGRFSEALLMAEDKRQVVRIESTPLEYWLATTDPQDIEVINNLKVKHPTLNDYEILKFAAQRGIGNEKGGVNI